LSYLRIKTLKFLLWLAYRVGLKSKLHLLQCPLCTAQSFMIDSYLYFYFDNISDASPAVLKLDLEISDAMIICRHCGEEIEIKDAAVELINRIIRPGASWIKL
jgi:Zn finger protein HypA/HybF involved in hydrogenase expression